MTGATASMTILVRGQKPHAIVESFIAQSSSPDADAEACRLAAAVARGDEAAFRQLYDGYRGRVFRLALVLARGDESIAHDAVQSVFITAARRLRRVETEKHLWHWFARITRQHIAKTWRRQKKDSPVIGMAELPDCADVLATDSVLEESLDAALTEMDPEGRQLIELFYFERLSHQEIAASLEVTPKAVSSRLERAREKLRLLVTRKLSHET
jgi:RNA polymerase sigma factor (sigma-70 family)